MCSTSGQCSCKPGVGGDKCDRCLLGFYDFSSDGCVSCNCHETGSVEGSVCDPVSGNCVCKPDVTGRRCSECVEGMVGPSRLTQSLCIPCHCNGYSRVCQSATGWFMAREQDQFDATSGLNGWSVEHGTAEIR